MSEFKAGDVVQLKNGTGPTMTIASLEHAAGEAMCVWLEGKKTQEEWRFLKPPVHFLTVFSP